MMNNDILLDSIDLDIYNTNSPKYFYKDKPIPRVTEILHSMINEDYITRWANSLGFKRINYKNILDRSSTIGSYVHESIEYLLTNGVIKIEFPNYIAKECTNGLLSFKRWFDLIQSNTIYEIISLEEELISPWFGGTMDMYIKINNKYYIVDFKTSNYISYRYILQLSAYKYILDKSNRQVDGLIILKLSKEDIYYDEYVIDLSKYENREYIEKCTNAFISFTLSYYNKKYIEDNFKRMINL